MALINMSWDICDDINDYTIFLYKKLVYKKPAPKTSDG